MSHHLLSVGIDSYRLNCQVTRTETTVLALMSVFGILTAQRNTLLCQQLRFVSFTVTEANTVTDYHLPLHPQRPYHC